MTKPRKCWSCGALMTPKGEYWQCACGATWNEVPEPGGPTMIVEKNPITGGTKYKPCPVRKSQRKENARP